MDARAYKCEPEESYDEPTSESLRRQEERVDAARFKRFLDAFINGVGTDLLFERFGDNAYAYFRKATSEQLKARKKWFRDNKLLNTGKDPSRQKTKFNPSFGASNG